MSTALHEWATQKLAERDRAGLRRRAVVTPRNAVDLAGNDYLGLSRNPRVLDAAQAALKEYGSGARASRLVTGTLAAHEALESALCELTGQPSALVFSSGYTANLGVLTALGDADTLIVSDAHVHASLVDGCRLSRSPVAIARHSDIADVERVLRTRDQPRALVVVESIYSVLGDHAPLRELLALCTRYDATLVVDEAHGIGVAGAGRGLVAELGLAGHERVLQTVTLSKALGAQGGAVLGPPAVRELLVSTARSFIFDTALAPSAAAAATEAARLIRAEPERAAALHERGRLIAATLGVPHARAAVQSVPMPDPEYAADAAARLRARGVLVGCFRPPSVPDGVSRLRLTARGDVPLPDVAEALELVREVLP